MIRRQLVVTIVVLVIAITGTAGLLAVDTLRNRQLDVIDEQLRAADRQAADYIAMARSADRGPPPLEALYEPFPYVMRRVAYVLLSGDGSIVWSFPAGTTQSPDPLPDVSELPQPGEMVSVPSVSPGGPRYRITTQSIDSGATLVMGTSLATADDTVASVIEILLVSGAIALVAVAAAVWFTVRRGLRPIEQMVVTARGIAEGDLSRRAPTPRAQSEVAQLGTALNTMLDRVEEAVEVKVASEAQMRRFVADASHELRTPLTSIRGYAELHRRGATDPEAVALGMARIEHEATRMAVLVDDLLLLARLDQGRSLEHHPVDLTGLVIDANQASGLLDPERPLTLLLPGRPVVVDGDARRLRQIVDNLLANVRTHTDPGTAATVELTSVGVHARLRVADEGPGMGAADADRAFERFYQADPGRPGTGIGLSIVAEVVDAHGGTVSLEAAPGQGTTVTVTLPLPLPSDVDTDGDAPGGSADVEDAFLGRGDRPASILPGAVDPASTERHAAPAADR